MTSVSDPYVATDERSKTEQLKENAAAVKDRITAPEAAPARRGGGAAVATAAATLGMWMWRRYRARTANKRRSMAARRHMKVIGHESKAVAGLGAAAFAEMLRHGADAARRQAGNGAQVARKQARVKVETAKMKAAKARR